jgi:hypothetical protein
MMRPFRDRPEVTEALVVTVSKELGISRSLVYRLVAKVRTAATGFAIEAVSDTGCFALIIILARQQIPENRGCLRFKYSVSTNLSQWIGLQSTN